MTEDEAKAWLRDVLNVSRETVEKLRTFRDIVVAENKHQNLIGTASINHIWARHIIDSAQLFSVAGSRQVAKSPSPKTFQTASTSNAVNQNENTLAAWRLGVNQPWLDLGTGAGFPGMIIAILSPKPITLVESRRRRADFLRDVAQLLALPHVTVDDRDLAAVSVGKFAVISARAFAPLSRLLAIAHRFSTPETLWLLPKGKSAQSELESVRGTWQGVFHVEQSVTDPEAGIIVATGVRPVGTR